MYSHLPVAENTIFLFGFICNFLTYLSVSLHHILLYIIKVLLIRPAAIMIITHYGHLHYSDVLLHPNATTFTQDKKRHILLSLRRNSHLELVQANTYIVDVHTFDTVRPTFLLMAEWAPVG